MSFNNKSELDDCVFDHYNEQDVIKNFEEKETKRSKRPRYFPSNKPQAFIKNAVSGVPYPYIVGSKEQQLLYKIVDATGKYDCDGFLIKHSRCNNLPNPNTNHLFYDNPEQCMSHLHLTFNPAHVNVWHENHQHVSNLISE